MTARDIGGTTPWIEIGTINHVDRKKFTVDWMSDSNDRRMFSVPISSPGFNQSHGEGASFLPEEGAKAIMCLPSDRSTPVILGFISDPEESDPDSDDDFAAGRKPTQSEELWGFHGRKGNQVSLYRDGTVMIQSNPATRRVYIPGGSIWDLASEYKLDTATGQWHWKAEEQTGLSKFVATFKDNKSASKATVAIRMGTLPDVPVVGPSAMEVVIAPQGIGKDGQASGQTYVFRVDQSGNSYEMQQASMTKIVNGSVTLTVNNKTETINGTFTLTVNGTEVHNVTGSLMNQALSIDFIAASMLQITAPVTRIGSPAAIDPAVKGMELVQWLATHTHPGPKIPPVEHIQELPTILSTALLLDPR